MSKIIKISLLLSAVGFLFFAGCKRNKPPETPDKPSGPTIIRKNAIGEYTTKTNDPNKDDEIRYIFDWGDGNLDTTRYFPNDSMADTTHVWIDTGHYQMKVRAQDNKNALSKEWSAPLSVIVNLNNPPLTPEKPSGFSTVGRRATNEYTTKSHDPDNDEIRYIFDWGDDSGFDTTDYFTSDSIAIAQHAWYDTGLFAVKVRAQDRWVLFSEWSDSLLVTVIMGRD